MSIKIQIPHPEPVVCIPLAQLLAAERLCGFAQSVDRSTINKVTTDISPEWRDGLLQCVADYRNHGGHTLALPDTNNSAERGAERNE